MLVDVVCLRRDGKKLPDAEVRAATPVRGELLIETARALDGNGEIYRTRRAMLAGVDGGGLLHYQLNPVVTRMTVDTIVAAGTEVQTGSMRTAFEYPQTWWCRVVSRESNGTEPVMRRRL